MATTLIRTGHRTWSMTRDAEGHREYKIKYRVKGLSTDGPANALRTVGLPTPGSPWLVDGDSDPWAFCRLNATVTPVEEEGEPNQYWDVEFTFSTKPPDTKACKDQEAGNPLLEPQKISGSFSKYVEEAVRDRFGQAITNSAHEQFRGPEVEFDMNRPQIRIEQNVAVLGIEVFSRMIDTLNNAPLWGLSRRKIKLSNVSWERKFYGTCSKYYTRTLEFDIRYDGWERDLLDEGTKVLHGEWNATTGFWDLVNIAGSPPDHRNPSHFMRFKDRQAENCRVILNGRGLPALSIVGTGKMYMSIVDNNIGNLLTDPTKWLELNPPLGPWLFDPEDEEGYVTGDLVYIEEDPAPRIFITLVDYPASTPLTSILDWQFIQFAAVDPAPGGEGKIFLNDPTNYSATTSYGMGEMVLDKQHTAAGNIHVEKYPESNFLLLGIPLIL